MNIGFRSVYALALTLCLVPLSTWAASFAGIIMKKPLKLVLLTPGESYELIASDSFVAKDLKKLKTGDFLQGYGDIKAERNKILVNSVDIVGLKNLLGKWVADDETIVDFTGFSELQVFVPSNNFPTGYEKPVTLQYSLSPDQGTTWGILLNSRTQVQTGLVDVHPESMSLSIKGSNSELQTIHFYRSK